MVQHLQHGHTDGHNGLILLPQPLTREMDHLQLRKYFLLQPYQPFFSEGNECEAILGGEHLLDNTYVPYIFMEWSLTARLKDPEGTFYPSTLSTPSIFFLVSPIPNACAPIAKGCNTCATITTTDLLQKIGSTKYRYPILSGVYSLCQLQ